MKFHLNNEIARVSSVISVLIKNKKCCLSLYIFFIEFNRAQYLSLLLLVPWACAAVFISTMQHSVLHGQLDYTTFLMNKNYIRINCRLHWFVENHVIYSIDILISEMCQLCKFCCFNHDS